jgi:hypothetical protein
MATPIPRGLDLLRPEIMAMVRDIGNARSEIAATRSSPSAGEDLGNGQASGADSSPTLGKSAIWQRSRRDGGYFGSDI